MPGAGYDDWIGRRARLVLPTARGAGQKPRSRRGNRQRTTESL